MTSQAPTSLCLCIFVLLAGCSRSSSKSAVEGDYALIIPEGKSAIGLGSDTLGTLTSKASFSIEGNTMTMLGAKGILTYSGDGFDVAFGREMRTLEYSGLAKKTGDNIILRFRLDSNDEVSLTTPEGRVALRYRRMSK